MHRQLIYGGLTILAAASTAAAQWSQQSPTASPSPRLYANVVFDPVAGQTLLFGGAPSFGSPLGDTWTYDGSTWTQLSPANSPSGRAQCSMVWDVNRGVAVLYGGGNTSFFGGPSIDETWEWNGSTWSQVITVNSPGGLALYGAAYDPVRQRTVVYGGQPDSFFPIASANTWEYDGLDWSQVMTASSPGPLEGPGMCYSPALNRVVLFGGIDPQTGGTDQTWTYDGTNWTQLAVAGPRPSPRAQPRMVCDQARGVVVLFGGFDPMNGNLFSDTWEFDGTGWQQINVPGPGPARGRSAMVMDASLGRVVLFGGADASFNALGDTWEYGATYATFGNGCAGSNGVPALSSSGTPRTGTTFTVDVTNLSLSSSVALMFTGLSDTAWVNGPLPADLGALGMPGCTAYVSTDLLSVLPANAGAASWSLALPGSGALVGQPFFNQAVSIDPGANAAGLVVSNAGAGVVGR